MLDKLLATAAANAKLALAAAAGAALVAGGSTVAISNVADSTPANAKGLAASSAQGDNRSATATATISPKPSKSPKATDGTRPDNHGTCVSEAVAKAKAGLAAGAKQGPVVSAAAKSCPKPGKGAATSAEAKKKSEAARKAAEAKKKAGQANRPADAGRPAQP